MCFRRTLYAITHHQRSASRRVRVLHSLWRRVLEIRSAERPLFVGIANSTSSLWADVHRQMSHFNIYSYFVIILWFRRDRDAQWLHSDRMNTTQIHSHTLGSTSHKEMAHTHACEKRRMVASHSIYIYTFHSDDLIASQIIDGTKHARWHIYEHVTFVRCITKLHAQRIILGVRIFNLIYCRAHFHRPTIRMC